VPHILQVHTRKHTATLRTRACDDKNQPARAHMPTRNAHTRATQGRMPARTCARALTQTRAEELSETHSRARTRARTQPSRIHHKTRMVSPPRCPNRHMATGGMPPTIHLMRATAPGPACRRYHQPPLHARDIRQAASPPPAVCQGNPRTPTLVRAQAATAHTQARVFARTSLAGAGYGGRRAAGTGARPGAGAHRQTNANRGHPSVTRPNAFLCV
jgi:hypothetical protein